MVLYYTNKCKKNDWNYKNAIQLALSLNAAVGTGKQHRGILLFTVVEQKAVESSRGRAEGEGGGASMIAIAPASLAALPPTSTPDTSSWIFVNITSKHSSSHT